MKTHSLYLLAVAGGAVFLSLAAPQSISGQNPAPASGVEAKGEVAPELLALIQELTSQNKQLVANQAAMDERIDAIAEAVRQARLMTARAAGKGASK